MEELESCPLLGQVLLVKAMVGPEALRAALGRQASTGKLLGEILVEMAAITPRELETALEVQARLHGNAQQARPFVLLVDDDLEVGALVRDVLIGAGYAVGVAQNGAEAVAAATASDSETPDLVVLDLGLGEEDGVELLARLRGRGSTRSVPVVVLTGHPEREAEIRARELEISEFLVKPVTVRELVAVVDRVLRHAGMAEQAPAL